MAVLPLHIRAAARRDIEAATDYLATEADGATAERFVDALQVVLRRVSTHPRSGSPQLAGELHLPGIRTIRVRRFPYLVVFTASEERAEVLRVLHERRDHRAALT